MSGYIGTDMTEQIKMQARQQAAQLMVASAGHVTSVDPVKYMAKVMLEPMGVETGWLPIGTLYAGAGFGLTALPAEGIEVLVVFEQGDLNVGRVILACFNNTDVPPANIKPGEVMLTHESGSLLHFTADGDIFLSPNAKLKLGGAGDPVARKGDSVTVDVPGIGPCSGTITTGSGIVQIGG